MSRYQCLIVDDEPIAQRVLQRYLHGHARVEVAHTAFHTHDARAWCAAHSVDLLLLDIEMPEETGLAFLRSLDKKPVTIFTTAHLEYALEGFDLGVLDYLVKPIRQERFDQALHRAVEFLDLLQAQSTLQPSAAAPAVVEILSGAKRISLPPATISHIQGLKDYAIIYTAERRHVVRATMRHLETLLEPHGFVRVHKSFIVAPGKLALLHRQKIEFDGFQVPVGRRFKPE